MSGAIKTNRESETMENQIEKACKLLECNVQELAAKLEIGKSTVYDWAERGQAKHPKMFSLAMDQLHADWLRSFERKELLESVAKAEGKQDSCTMYAASIFECMQSLRSEIKMKEDFIAYEDDNDNIAELKKNIEFCESAYEELNQSTSKYAVVIIGANCMDFATVWSECDTLNDLNDLAWDY